MKGRILHLIRLGFNRDQAELIASGDDVRALPEDELLRFASAIEHDNVRRMEPLVEKYGWDELFERAANSVADDT